jgi:shikimate kinase
MKILICGFMGSGKSHWLDTLKKKSSISAFQFLDLDHEIAKSLNIKPSLLGEWIKKYDWPAFRKLEQEMIASFLGEKKDGVLSLGGGSLTENLIDRCKSNNKIKIVFLNTPFDVCFERITGDDNRPLAALEKEELRSLYETRFVLYGKADLILGERERKEIDGIDSLVHTLWGPV